MPPFLTQPAGAGGGGGGAPSPGGGAPQASPAQGAGYLGWSCSPEGLTYALTQGFSAFDAGFMHAVRIPVERSGLLGFLRYHLTQAVGAGDWQGVTLYADDGPQIAHLERDTFPNLLSGAAGLKTIPLENHVTPGGPGLEVEAGSGVWACFTANAPGFGLARLEPDGQTVSKLNGLPAADSNFFGPKFGRVGATDTNLVAATPPSLPPLRQGWTNDRLPWVALLPADYQMES